ncbi:putative carboxypeptidase s1 protein [Lasiodiplodia theobromae]|nr:putative carboxypeptidase s1 protein [Lasiodiplodia theobromae]
MFSNVLRTSAAAALLSASGVAAFMKLPLKARGVPADATDVKTIVSPTNVTIRYKEPGKAGICETTPGVNS